VNPPLKLLRTSEATPAEFLASNPNIISSLERSKGKIALKARFEADALGADLKLILSDWCGTRKIVSIAWASALDPVKPEFAIDHLVDRLAQRLAEVRFAQFLERFADDLIELDRNERRSQ
jgi:hypothetical protein